MNLETYFDSVVNGKLDDGLGLYVTEYSNFSLLLQDASLESFHTTVINVANVDSDIQEVSNLLKRNALLTNNVLC